MAVEQRTLTLPGNANLPAVITGGYTICYLPGEQGRKQPRLLENDKAARNLGIFMAFFHKGLKS